VGTALALEMRESYQSTRRVSLSSQPLEIIQATCPDERVFDAFVTKGADSFEALIERLEALLRS
jgi:hypothetical protein